MKTSALVRSALAAGALFVSAPPASADDIVVVPGTSDPWLAGMPDGSMASFGDVAPDQSPVIVPLAVAAGEVLRFSASGAVAFSPSNPLTPPDGSFVVSHATGAENGISSVAAPVNALLGVFLGEAQPSLDPAPATLNFGAGGNVPGGIDYVWLTPELKQVFFIGDGLTSGAVAQEVVVPVGATRLALGTMDGQGWFNNIGSFSVTVESPWTHLGHALAGTHGLPRCEGTGSLVAGSAFSLALLDARENATAYLVFGLSNLSAPLKGGVMVPNPDFYVALPTGPSGALSLPSVWPAGVPSGVAVYVQWWIVDPLGVVGFAASNGVSATAP